MDVSSTSSDSETDYLTPLTGLRKEELLQKERELQTRSKRSKDKKKHEKKSKRKRKKRFVHSVVLCIPHARNSPIVWSILTAHQVHRIVTAHRRRPVRRMKAAAAAVAAVQRQQPHQAILHPVIPTN